MSDGEWVPSGEDVTPAVPTDRATPRSLLKQQDVEGVPGTWVDGEWQPYGSLDPKDPNYLQGPPPPTSVGQKLGMAGESFVRGFKEAAPLPSEKYFEDPENPSVRRTRGTLATEVGRRRKLEQEGKEARYLTGSSWLSSVPEFAGGVAGDPSMWVGVPGSSTTARKLTGEVVGELAPEALRESRAGRAAGRSWNRWSQTWEEAREADRVARSYGRGITGGMRGDVPFRNLRQMIEVAIGSIPGGQPIVRETERMQAAHADELSEIVHSMATEPDVLAAERDRPFYMNERGEMVDEAGRPFQQTPPHGREITGGTQIYQHFRSLGYPPENAAWLGILQNWQPRLRPDELRLLEQVFARSLTGRVTDFRNANHAQAMDRLFEYLANSREHATLSGHVFNAMTQDMNLEQRRLLGALMLHRMGRMTRGAQGQLRPGGQWTLENFLRNWEGMDARVRTQVFGEGAIGYAYERDINRIVANIQAVRRYAPMAARGAGGMTHRPFPLHTVGGWTEGAAVIGGLLGWLAGRPGGEALALSAGGFAGGTAAAAWGITNPAKARWIARQLTRYTALAAEHQHRMGALSDRINDPDFLDELNIAQGPEAPLTDPQDRGPWRVPKPLPQ